MTTIHKIIRPETDFTIVPNWLLRKKTLSFRARGLLMMVLSNSSDWITTQGWIEEQGPEGREAVRTTLDELEKAGHLRRGVIKAGGRFCGYMMTWYMFPVEDGDSATELPEDGLPPSGNAEPKNSIIKKKIPKGENFEKPAKPEYPMGCEPANAVDLDLTAPDQVRALWKFYQEYRTERHHMKGPERLAWTPVAAKSAAEGISRHVLSHGEQMVADRIRQAIAGRWKGLNFHTLGQPYNPHPNAASHQHPNSGGARKFAALGQPAPVTEYETDLTGEIR